ncbi:hypothetical protein [Candidatus Accumulibacter sp. ACC012]|uniref:hypothetical protein n=1 Tax=Candidatus Accumulibacter sp. ACC012 TaxID=2823332 RepID=UPI0025C19A49|nr:hypothetical protein [Candidatus Accumulibacter sp. ACC012]
MTTAPHSPPPTFISSNCARGWAAPSPTLPGPAVDEYGDEFFGLVITLTNGQKRTLIFLADDEGNGPGSFQLDSQG